MALNQNQFALQVILGMVDMRYSSNTIAAQVDSTQATGLVPGQAVKMVDSSGGVPKVIACAANSDEVLGFVNYDIKTVSFDANEPVEISLAGNVMYLQATAAIARGAQVQLDVSIAGGVTAKVGSSGADILGWALDKASASGDLIRVMIATPSFAKA